MAELTTDDLVRVVRAYFKGHELNFVMENIEYGGKSQTNAILMLDKSFNVSEHIFGRVTEIRMHGFWNGKASGDHIDVSQWPELQCWNGLTFKTKFIVTDIHTMLNVQLPEYLPLKVIALPQGGSAAPVSRQDWVILLKRLADMLENGSI